MRGRPYTLSEETRQRIMAMLAEGHSVRETAATLGVTRHKINEARNGAPLPKRKRSGRLDFPMPGRNPERWRCPDCGGLNAVRPCIVCTIRATTETRA